jgi:hypothetical protein
MFARLTKTVQSLAYIALIYVSYKWISGELDWNFSVACVTLSALWLGLTAHEMTALFRSYFDILSRAKVIIPLLFGLALGGLTMLAPLHASEGYLDLSSILPFWPDALDVRLTTLKMIGAVEIIFWCALYFAYRHNKSKYQTQGHGPLPKGAWISPDPLALQEGDLILTSGRVAKRLHETVGHGEVVIVLDGKLCTWSSFMEKGAVVQDLKEVAESNLKYGHYVAMRLSKPLDAGQTAVIKPLIEIMLRQNAEWKQTTLAKRDAFFRKFHFPTALRNFINKKVPVSGYDWWGLFTGRLAGDHWTCIGAVLELYARVGVKTNAYGTGLFGLGTGILDPIKPVRFLGDPAFRLLDQNDRAAFNARNRQPAIVVE